MARLRDNAATLDLEQGDAKKIEADITSAKARAVELGQAAKSSCSEILWALATARRANAKAKLEEILDFSAVGAGQNLETAARSVRELQPLQHYFAHSATAHEADYQLALLHQLRENFSQVRAMCEAEPGLTIPAITIVKPAEAAVAEYESPASGNRLGTVAQQSVAA